MNRVLFIVLSLVPFFTFGHLRTFLGVPFGFSFYAASYFFLGYLQHRYFFAKKETYFIVLLPLFLFSAHLLSETMRYFPSYVPALFFIGLLSYILGLKFFSISLGYRALYMIVLSTLIIGWCNSIMPLIFYQNTFNKKEYAYLLNKKVDFELKNLEGKPINKEVFNGKVVILDFWYSKCAYCFEKFPIYDELYLHYKENPNIVIGTVVPGAIDSVSDILKVLEKNHLEAPVFYDSASLFINKYKIGHYGYPIELRIDKSGVIRQTISGFSGEETRSVYLRKSIQSIDEYLK